MIPVEAIVPVFLYGLLVGLLAGHYRAAKRHARQIERLKRTVFT